MTATRIFSLAKVIEFSNRENTYNCIGRTNFVHVCLQQSLFLSFKWYHLFQMLIVQSAVKDFYTNHISSISLSPQLSFSLAYYILCTNTWNNMYCSVIRGIIQYIVTNLCKINTPSPQYPGINIILGKWYTVIWHVTPLSQ